MKKAALLVPFLLMWVISCGSSNPADPDECDPVADTGCSKDEKCAVLITSDDPLLVRTTCVPEGSVSIGGECEFGNSGEETGFDDCEGGSLCSGGVCVEICTASPDSCPAGLRSRAWSWSSAGC